MKKVIATSLLALGLFSGTTAYAEDYTIDTEGMHAFIQFRIKHLGYSWLYGRFDKFKGDFSYDEKNPADAKVQVTIDTTSISAITGLKASSCGCRILSTEDTTNWYAMIRIRNATISPEIYSIRPCPNGCSGSGSFPAR